MVRWKPTAPGETVHARLLVASPHSSELARFLPVDFTVSMLNHDSASGDLEAVLVCDPTVASTPLPTAPSNVDLSSSHRQGQASGVYSFDFEQSSHNPLLVAVGLKQHWAEFDDIIPFDQAKNDLRVPNFILMPCYWLGKQVGRLILFKLKLQQSILGHGQLSCAVKGKLPYAIGGLSSGWQDFCELAVGTPVRDQLMDSSASWTMKLFEGEDVATAIVTLVREDQASGTRRMIHAIEGRFHEDNICTVCCVPWNPAEDITYVLKKQSDCSPPPSRRGSESSVVTAREEQRLKDTGRRGYMTNPFLK